MGVERIPTKVQESPSVRLLPQGVPVTASQTSCPAGSLGSVFSHAYHLDSVPALDLV